MISAHSSAIKKYIFRVVKVNYVLEVVFYFYNQFVVFQIYSPYTVNAKRRRNGIPHQDA